MVACWLHRREPMIAELLVRFFAGGAIVALFALLGEAFKTKTFSGLFGAAPSVAVVTLSIVLVTKGRDQAVTEARTMTFACVALLAYTATCVVLTRRHGLPVWLGAGLAYAIWVVIALGGWKLGASAG